MLPIRFGSAYRPLIVYVTSATPALAEHRRPRASHLPVPGRLLGVEPVMNSTRRNALLRASALSVAVAALAAACSSSNSGTASSSTSPVSTSPVSSGSAVAASGSDLVIGTIGNFSGPTGEPEHLAG